MAEKENVGEKAQKNDEVEKDTEKSQVVSWLEVGKAEIDDTIVQTTSQVEAFEDVLNLCGDGGPWQLKMFSLTGFGGMLTAFHAIAYAFIGAIPDHWCKLPKNPRFTSAELKNLTIPMRSDGSYEQCRRCVVNNWDTGNFDANDINCNRTIMCKSWDYDTSEFISTIASEVVSLSLGFALVFLVEIPTERTDFLQFNLVCSRTFLVSLVQACYMFGILVGSPVFGAMSDKLGRRLTILISAIIFCIAGPVIGIAPNYATMMFGRFILGLSTPGVFATAFVLLIENVGLEWRGLAGNLFNLWFALGYVSLPLVAYNLRNWRHLQYVLCVPSISLLISWYFVNESPRWLLRVGKVDQGEEVLRIVAKFNRKELPDDFHELCLSIANKEKIGKKQNCLEALRHCKVLNGFVELLKSRRIRTRTLVIYFCWFSIGMIYYGLALSSPNLSADRYIYTLIGGLLEIPSSFMVPPLIRYFGRRFVFSGFILSTGVALLVSLAFEEGSAMVIILALFGKLQVGAAFALIYVYATEVFPTLLRTYGLGSASLVGRIGSVIAPFVVDLVGMKMNLYPAVVFGIFSIAAGLSALLLPETRGRRLPETVQEVEEFS